MIFELIVVDTREQAKDYPVIQSDELRQEVVFIGQGICGLHYRGIRPNKLTRLCRELSGEHELSWERECLIPAVRLRGVSE